MSRRSNARRWTSRQAWQWYKSQKGPMMGANYVPSTCSSTIDMWNAQKWEETERVIARELGWASNRFNFNSMRVFLHNLPYQHEGQGYLDRVDRFLQIATSVGIDKTILVLLDGCWDPQPVYYTDEKAIPPIRPQVHNSRWVQAPGKHILTNATAQEELIRPYVESVVSNFGNDSRVLLIDLFNEPDNDNDSTYGHYNKYPRVPPAQDAMGTELLPLVKHQAAYDLVVKVHEWARSVGPIQTPLTVADWEFAQPPMKRWAMEHSDVLSFHNFQSLDQVQQHVLHIKEENVQKRPIICTEYMARTTNSTFDPVLGFLFQHNIWAFHWGLVAGKSQTNYPWDSWYKQYTEEPKLWLHDLLLPNGQVYKETEQEYILGLGVDDTSTQHNALVIGDHTVYLCVGGVLIALWLVVRAAIRRRKHIVCIENHGVGQSASIHAKSYGLVQIKVA